jgi:hypothetical protein
MQGQRERDGTGLTSRDSVGAEDGDDVVYSREVFSGWLRWC